jgi:glycerol-3-phosphate cytidylyltransferase
VFFACGEVLKKILTLMVADLFHLGHINLLQRANKLGEVYVGVPTSAIAGITKKKKIVMSFEERLHLVVGCRYVHFAFGYASDADIDKLLDVAKFDLYVRGDDWIDFPCKKTIEKHNIPIKYLPYTKGISSTELRKRVIDIEIEKGAYVRHNEKNKRNT